MELGPPTTQISGKLSLFAPAIALSTLSPRERDDARTNASRTCVAVGSIAGVELVTAADDVERGLSDEVIQQREVEVAGNGEDVGNIDFDEAAREVATERRVSAAIDDGGRNAGVDDSGVGMIAGYEVVGGRLCNVQ